MNIYDKYLPLLFCGVVLMGDGQQSSLLNMKTWVY